MKKLKLNAIFLLLLFACTTQKQGEGLQKIRVSANHRYFETQNGDPFFWLGDTGWLLFKKLNREDAEKYINDRAAKGFNVIQVMVLHNIKDAVNVYGDSAISNFDITKPVVTEGNNPTDTVQYDFWDHVDYIVDLAAKKGIYIAMVPLWGSNVKSKEVTPEKAAIFAKWLANRYKDKTNIIWMNGGDISGGDSTAVWEAIGNNINETDTNHLITYHPRGRTQSSFWFHNDKWLDFNMFQSGHRNYAQDTSVKEKLHYGEDNWKYIQTDYNLTPVKPTLDGEPSYEKIPMGLHDTLQPYWTDDDVRRYGYWSVFAGACGFTYGHNSVMQFYRKTDKGSAYGAKNYWSEAINDSGAQQMKYLKELMLSRPYFERVPDQSLVADQGEKYNYILATRGENYAFCYTYTGRDFTVNMGKIKGDKVKASWYSPRDGKITEAGKFDNKGTVTFNPPGEPKDGNDWVLILDSK